MPPRSSKPVNLTDLPDELDLIQVAERLGMTRRGAARLVSVGHLTACKVDGLWTVSAQALRDYAARRGQR